MAEKKVYTIYDDKNNGTVQIAEDVMALIAAMAATEVEGVAALKGNISGSQVTKAGLKSILKSTKLQVNDGKVKVQLILNIKSGYNLPDTCRKVQLKVKDNLESMTGLSVQSVDVSIADVEIVPERGRGKGKSDFSEK